jgi:hypothetical protein
MNSHNVSKDQGNSSRGRERDKDIGKGKIRRDMDVCTGQLTGL